MATNSGVSQANLQQKKFQISGNPHHCKECGLFLNSAESLEVHLQYHKENLLTKWAMQGTSNAEETNNNTTLNNSKISQMTTKREFSSNTVSAAADSSDSMFKSRGSPEMILGHPPTPQSYNSASSPYHNHENSFSPEFQNYQVIKTERSSPNNFQQPYRNYHENQYYLDNSHQQQSNNFTHQEFAQKIPQSHHSVYRYHPYQQQNYDRNSRTQVSSSSPAYPPQPTPSPSPKQCDKCGYVCESASQLIDHISVSHSSNTQSYQVNRQFVYGNQPHIKTENDSQSEILDLDSHKVHQVFPPEDDKHQNSENEEHAHNPHSVSSLLSSWNQHQQQLIRQTVFPTNVTNPRQDHTDQKVFRTINDYHLPSTAAGVSTTSEDGRRILNQQQTFRSFDHISQPSTGSVISSSQIPPSVNNSPVPTKGGNWKSNEARRPKTYNCTACNKWFTSSGHLKRHYNTTLHKNAVKTSGQPDPASLPISAHHHPAKDANSSRSDDQSPDPMEDPRSDTYDQPSSIPNLLQQSPGNLYDRSIHNPGMQSPINNLSNQNSLSNGSFSNLSSSSPPNGEAGPSAITNMDSRGLLSLPGTPNSPFSNPMQQYMAASPSHHVMHQAMDNTTFQMYPNGSAPHVMQVTATNNPNTTGELFMATESQPLPSFAQIQAHRFGLLLGYGAANVGGVGPTTVPFTTTTAFYQEPFNNDMRTFIAYRSFHDEQFPSEIKSMISNDTAFSSINNNNLIQLQNVSGHLEEPKNIQIITNNDIKLETDSRPISPEQNQFEENNGTSSPIITSTVQTKPSKILHKCFDCDKMFNKACYLTQHNKTFHSGDKPFKCSRCGKRFSCEKQYQDHTSKHAGEKPYKCDLCPKQFNHKTDLRRHMCLHTGQKPFSCDTCGKGFIRKDHMLKHCDTHNRKSTSKVATIR